MLAIKTDPLKHQEPMLASPARYKLNRWGRRSGKTRSGVIAGIAGHGPNRMWKGLAQGGKIVWLAPDYPQADEVWRTEIRPRLSGVQGLSVSKTARIVEASGGGSLEIRTAENIDSVRGRKLDGVVFDEAAHMDLEYAWNDVLRPALADRQGWAIFNSTPNAGPDGNSAKRAPSYFNRLCADQEKGALGLDWAQWHFRTRDNPLIAPAEVDALYAGYPANSPVSQQELDALLITGGAGLAFPEWNDSVHVVANRTQFPMDWEWVGTLDWGYRQGHYGLWGISTEGDTELVWEFSEQFTSRNAYEAALSIFNASQIYPTPRQLYYDGQMDQEHGIRGGMTLTREWAEGMAQAFGGEMAHMPIMFPTTKGAGSRVVKKNIMHRYLAWTDKRIDPEKPATLANLPPWHRPRLRAQAKCQGFISCMKALPLDPIHPDDVDTKAVDHPYDSACMLLVTRPIAISSKPEFQSQDVLRMADIGRAGRRKWETMQEEIQRRGQPDYGSGFRMPRPEDYKEMR
jgi:hypothetical protein